MLNNSFHKNPIKSISHWLHFTGEALRHRKITVTTATLILTQDTEKGMKSNGVKTVTKKNTNKFSC